MAYSVHTASDGLDTQNHPNNELFFIFWQVLDNLQGLMACFDIAKYNLISQKIWPKMKKRFVHEFQLSNTRIYKKINKSETQVSYTHSVTNI